MAVATSAFLLFTLQVLVRCLFPLLLCVKASVCKRRLRVKAALCKESCVQKLLCVKAAICVNVRNPQFK